MAKKKSLRERTQKPKLTLRYNGDYIDRSGKTYSHAEGVKLLMEGKASIAEWHGGKKKAPTSGRQKGAKNLVKLDDGRIQNKHGVVFTEAEKRKLESAVNQANKKRRDMLKEEANLPRLQGGKHRGDSVASLQAMGKESDFIISRKTKSLQRFESKEQFERYLDNLRKINSPDYIEDRTRLYKRNHMKALENVFGDDAKDVIMKIRMMKPEEYRRRLQADEFLEVNYIYDPSARTGKLNQIRQSLGMQEKEEEYEE